MKKNLKSSKDTQSNRVQWKWSSYVGDLYFVASDFGLEGVYWQQVDIPLLNALDSNNGPAVAIKAAIHELERYFSGEKVEFTEPSFQIGTDFQKRVWGELKSIPYGETRSYLDIAKSLNNQGAVRAVGSANGKNPFSIIVPCHRVINANGDLGGYAGGLQAKKMLLELESRSAG